MWYYKSNGIFQTCEKVSVLYVAKRLFCASVVFVWTAAIVHFVSLRGSFRKVSCCFYRQMCLSVNVTYSFPSLFVVVSIFLVTFGLSIEDVKQKLLSIRKHNGIIGLKYSKNNQINFDLNWFEKLSMKRNALFYISDNYSNAMNRNTERTINWRLQMSTLLKEVINAKYVYSFILSTVY